MVLVDQAPRHASVAAIVAADLAERTFGTLAAPPRLVTALDCSVPNSKPLEDVVIPNVDQIIQAVHSVVG